MKSSRIERYFRGVIQSPKLDHWHFDFMLVPGYTSRIAMFFCIGFFKLIELPAEGDAVQPKHYKGFRFTIDFNIPCWQFSKNLPKRKKTQVFYDEASPEFLFGVERGLDKETGEVIKIIPKK